MERNGFVGMRPRDGRRYALLGLGLGRIGEW